MKNFQDQLQETINSAILKSQQRTRASARVQQMYSGSPVLEHDSDVRKILSVTEVTERSFRCV